ncbi:hypothetical protein CBL_06375 [Carabus blaptoides fortunei]
MVVVRTRDYATCSLLRSIRNKAEASYLVPTNRNTRSNQSSLVTERGIGNRMQQAVIEVYRKEKRTSGGEERWTNTRRRKRVLKNARSRDLLDEIVLLIIDYILVVDEIWPTQGMITHSQGFRTPENKTPTIAASE